MENDLSNDPNTDFFQAPPDQKVAAFLAYAKRNVRPEITDNDTRHGISMTLTSAVQFDEIDLDEVAGPILDIAGSDLDFGPDVVGQDHFNEEWDKLVSLVSQIKE